MIFHTTLDCLKYQFLVQIPDFIRYPEKNRAQILSSYQQAQNECLAMRNNLGSTPMIMLDTRYQTGYGMLLSLAMFLNSIVSVFRPHDISLPEESATMRSEIMTLAWQVMDRRPLGAGYIPVCLIAAWIGSNDLMERAEIEVMILRYRSGFTELRWLEKAIAFKQRLQRLRPKFVAKDINNLHHGKGYVVEDVTADTTEETMEDIGDPCCIL
jgi:hypothetical protein